MKYKMIRISVYNEQPQEPNSFYCDASIPDGMTFDQLLQDLVEPAFHVVHSKLIPDPPALSKDMKDFMEWSSKYYGGIDGRSQ